MSATPIATIPTTWDDSRDGAFFRITAGLFSGDFCFGVLLANYDQLAPPVCAPRRRRASPGPAGQAVNEKTV